MTAYFLFYAIINFLAPQTMYLRELIWFSLVIIIVFELYLFGKKHQLCGGGKFIGFLCGCQFFQMLD